MGLPLAAVFDVETLGIVPEGEREAIAAMARRRDQDPETFSALSPPLTRVLAVGLLNVQSDTCCVIYDSELLPEDVSSTEQLRVEPRAGEAALLTAVSITLERFSHLVGFNSRAFDIPVLIHRSIINRVPVPTILRNSAWQKPWESRPHVDLLNEFTFGRAGDRYPLGAYALGYGVGNPKAHCDGSRVGELVEKRDTGALIRYLEGDVRTTAALWRRWEEFA